MKKFLDKDFLLNNEVAVDLYENHAKKMPIFDYHCHLVPQQIYEDYHFKNITEAWLGANHYGDHYKWRLLREFGVDEKYITGDADDYERFLKFAEVMPYMVGNPIYQWTHLELRRYFGIDKLLSPETAKEIYDECNEKLKTLSARKMIEMFNVDTLFTTDDPADDLHYHELMAKDPSLKVHVAPAWRPDKAINVERDTFLPWLKKLSEVCNRDIKSLQDLFDCLDERLQFFVKHGCVASDHALDVVHFKAGATYEDANKVFLKALNHETITFEDEDIYKGVVLVFLGKEYSKYNIVQQYHIGALRNNSPRMYKELGPDTGYDAIEDMPVAEKLSGLMAQLDA
ncbi:MAG: glucuronate isomerase, partial [Firmicutes bacterium]|nr:glucuronate isomerase [Candidatus Scatoplasma merdavium]